jgi:hypothetical protein
MKERTIDDILYPDLSVTDLLVLRRMAQTDNKGLIVAIEVALDRALDELTPGELLDMYLVSKIPRFLRALNAKGVDWGG